MQSYCRHPNLLDRPTKLPCAASSLALPIFNYPSDLRSNRRDKVTGNECRRKTQTVTGGNRDAA